MQITQHALSILVSGSLLLAAVPPAVAQTQARKSRLLSQVRRQKEDTPEHDAGENRQA